jgi:hypothetical protein
MTQHLTGRRTIGWRDRWKVKSARRFGCSKPAPFPQGFSLRERWDRAGSDAFAVGSVADRRKLPIGYTWITREWDLERTTKPAPTAQPVG